MAEHDVKYKGKVERARDIKSFRFERPDDFEYSPGQFFFINIPKDGETLEHHFTLTSSPTEDYLEFTTRMTGSDFKNTMDALGEGTHVHIKGPYGVFTPTEEMKKVAYICGGIGVTPSRPAIKWTLETKASLDIILLHGNRDLESIPFKEEFDSVTSENIKIVYVLSRQEEWEGSKGRINAEIVKSEIQDWQERTFFVSGPPSMVESLKKMLLEELHILANKIKFENFIGYD